ncbi:N-acetyltransferase [Lactiplantibacillus sp. WILCCON 0030]|uniref:N-acetyltransferase n=1 Tax=Lactiplantibacillus brownii TaxID=3069269 RepID=A0ABU1AB03_9LACO|nr:N-acetyltransferase [Lactiplantibacillus brownii]MDQ7938139.1 N-acetyltransferase [Lactiplantibacillus brownii]
MEIKLQTVLPSQFAVTAAVVEKAFTGIVQSDHDEHQLIGRLRKSPQYQPTFDLLASTTAGEIIGFSMLSVATVNQQPATGQPLMVLAPLAVLPAYQGQGVGSALVRELERRAHIAGVPAISILGDSAYYGRFGYTTAADFNITAPFDLPDENFMLHELTPHALTHYHGKLHYDAAFGIN